MSLFCYFVLKIARKHLNVLYVLYIWNCILLELFVVTWPLNPFLVKIKSTLRLFKKSSETVTLMAWALSFFLKF